MKFRHNKRGSFDVSEVSFGCMSLPENSQESSRIIRAAFDAGFNYFDTADIYQNGLNEEMVGESISSFRKQVILATKVGNEPKANGSGWNWNPLKSYILKSVEGSLKRLKTDYIDVYQLHGGTIDDDVDETLEAFELLKEQGKILHYGLSSIRPNVIEKWKQTDAISNMLQYSLLDRRAEESVLKELQKNDIGVMVRGAIAKGVLFKKDKSKYLDYSIQEIDNMRDKMNSFSIEKNGYLRLQLAWVLRNKAVSSVVIGIRNLIQLNEIIDLVDHLSVDDETYDQLSALFIPKYYTNHRVDS